jgi:hypothetical protein
LPLPRLAAALVRVRAALTAIAVIAWAGGIPGARLRDAPLDPRIQAVPHDVRDRNGRVDVAVRNPEGAPIAHARVRAFAIVLDRAYLADAKETDAGGTAHLAALPLGEAWLMVDAAGYARGSSHLVVAATRRSIAIELGVGHAIDVSLKDELDAPIAGGTIEAAGDGDPLPVGQRTLGDGRAHVDRLGPGPWHLTASAPGFEDAIGRADRDGEVVTMTLRKLGAITVHVIDAGGQPAGHARIAVAGATLWPARLAEADDGGNLRIGSLAAGTFALRATRDAAVSPIEVGVTLGRGEEKSVELRLGPGRFVGVFVTDGESDDADPVPGARVTLAEGGLSPFPFEATTDKRGRARLGPIAPGAATLSARADGFVPRGAVAVGDPPPPESRVVLVHAASLTGRVVDVRGDPVDGATIEIAGTDLAGGPVFQDPRRALFQSAHFDAMLAGPAPLLPAGELGVVPGPVPPVPLAGLAPAAVALPDTAAAGGGSGDPWVTRDDGTFRAYPVSPGRIRAVVHHPQYVEAESEFVSLSPGGEGHVEIVLHEGGTLEGRVLDARDRPVAGARIVASATRGSLEKTTRSATDGTFAFAALPESVTLGASAGDDETSEVRTTVTIPEGGRQEVTLHLPEAREALPLTVVDERGGPVGTVQVTAVSLAPDSPFRATAFTDANGEASIPHGRGLPLRVEVRAPSRAPKVVVTDAATDALRIELGAAESASGQVVTARGRDAIAGADVTLYTDLGARRARTDAGGAFTLSDLAPGDARLRVTAPGVAPVSMAVTIPDTNGRRPFAMSRIEMAAEGIVEGTVVDSSDAPVVGARVAEDHVPTWLVVGASPAGFATTDGRGKFHLGGLPDGPVTLEAYAPDLGRARTTVAVQAGRTTDRVRLALGAEPGASPDPGAAASVAVTLGETAAPVEVVIASVADGSEAERAGLAPGDVLVAVDGAAVASIEEARSRLSGPLANDVLVSIRRAGQTQSLRVERDLVRK